MKKPVCPCIKKNPCPNRTAKCHSTCEEYIEYEAELRAYYDDKNSKEYYSKTAGKYRGQI